MARKEKKPVHHVQMTEGKRAIIQQLLQEYDIETAEDIQDALKDLLGGTIKEMMEAEMDDHLGYSKSERIDRSEQDDYRNGTKQKQVNSSYGPVTIDVPAGPQLHLRAPGRQKTPEGYLRDRPEDHLDVCQRNDHPADLRYPDGYLWF